jgi:hypothetical protein
MLLCPVPTDPFPRKVREELRPEVGPRVNHCNARGHHVTDQTHVEGDLVPFLNGGGRLVGGPLADPRNPSDALESRPARHRLYDEEITHLWVLIAPRGRHRD